MEIKIGSLGNMNFPRGYYVYTGSALGNLSPRIKRHLIKNKKLKWHIDYLLASKFAKIIKIITIEAQKRLECAINQKIQNIANSYVKNFGCSDCKCKSHLAFFKMNDAIEFVDKIYSEFYERKD